MSYIILVEPFPNDISFWVDSKEKVAATSLSWNPSVQTSLNPIKHCAKPSCFLSPPVNSVVLRIIRFPSLIGMSLSLKNLDGCQSAHTSIDKWVPSKNFWPCWWLAGLGQAEVVVPIHLHNTDEVQWEFEAKEFGIKAFSVIKLLESCPKELYNIIKKCMGFSFRS